MTQLVPVRRRLLDALTAQNTEEVVDILSKLRQDLGEERFRDILLDLIKRHPDTITTFLRRPGGERGLSVMETGVPATHAISKSQKLRLSPRYRARRMTHIAIAQGYPWALHRKGSEPKELGEPHETVTGNKTWYAQSAVARVVKVDYCAIEELDQLSLEDGLDALSGRAARERAELLRAVAEHLELVAKR